MELMSSNKISHIPIVKNKIPIGIVYIVDIVNILIEKNIILKLNVKILLADEHKNIIFLLNFN